MQIPFYFLILLFPPLLACGTNAKDRDKLSGNDASPLVYDASSSALDASGISPDASPSIEGTWKKHFQTGPTYDSYRMILSGSNMEITRNKRDGFGEFRNCHLIESWSGEWSTSDTRITLTPISGRTRRTQNTSEVFDCDPQTIYNERDMSVEELAAHDILSGQYSVDQRGRLVIETENGTVWGWRKEE